jgi:hypothetical protein
MLTAYHPEVVQCGFVSREYNENYIENVDETHSSSTWRMEGL